MAVVSFDFLLFCGLLLLLYYTVLRRFQLQVLLIASYLFYISHGVPNLVYILFTTLSTYVTGLVLNRYHFQYEKAAAKRRGRLWLLLCICSNFGMLFLCKIRLLQGGLLPLGISFYLFQSMGYLIDVYRGSTPAERNLGKFALFVSFLPQLIQGPISRAGNLLPQLTAPHVYNGKQVSFGLQRMLWGYFKKLVIAERIAPAVICLRGAEYTGTAFLMLSLFYAIQIYGDFTGGIDILLGFSEALGFSLPENFCRPFFAKNTAEFWRRWHITLGEWMKDYIFYPISISQPMLKLSRFARKRIGKAGKRIPVYAASIATWFATGIWHGLTPNFILWGMMNCGVIILSQEMTPLYKKFHAQLGWKNRKMYGTFEILRTFMLMNLIRISDLFPNVGEYFRRMGTLLVPTKVNFLQIGLSKLDWGILLIGCGLLLAVSLIQEKQGSVRELLWQKNWLLRDCLLFGLLLVVLLMGCYSVGYNAGNFIYSQF